MKTHPEWLDKALFYQVYPQSFFDSDNDGIGDIKGIDEKLDYIKNLGFDSLWINPCFLSPFYDAGYDITDYKKVAPRYGTNADLYKLFRDAHKKGMHVLLDLVPGHTSVDCSWFTKSCLAKENEFSNRYIWTKSVWQVPKDLPVLRGFSQRDGSVVTNFFSIQPALNYGFNEVKEDYEEPIDGKGPQSTIEAIKDVIRFWLSKGCDGFRVDMAGWLVKRDPYQEGTVKVWKQIFSSIKDEYPSSVFVSEWNNPALSLKAGFDSDFLLQDEFNPYNSILARSENPYFRFDEKKKDAKMFFNHFIEVLAYAKEENKFVSLISGNHDTKRIGSFLSKEELKFYYTFLFTSPGVPFLYYGDEIGMTHEENIPSVEGGYSRTGSRSPMQWTKEKNAGFSTSKKPYIPINPSRDGISVEEENEDSNSLLSYIRRLLSFKRSHVSLDNDAEYELVKTEGYSPLIYIRRKENERLLIAINVSNKKYSVSFSEEFYGDILWKENDASVDVIKKKIKLLPHSLIIIK